MPSAAHSDNGSLIIWRQTTTKQISAVVAQCYKPTSKEQDSPSLGSTPASPLILAEVKTFAQYEWANFEGEMQQEPHTLRGAQSPNTERAARADTGARLASCGTAAVTKPKGSGVAESVPWIAAAPGKYFYQPLDLQKHLKHRHCYGPSPDSPSRQ